MKKQDQSLDSEFLANLISSSEESFNADDDDDFSGSEKPNKRRSKISNIPKKDIKSSDKATKPEKKPRKN